MQHSKLLWLVLAIFPSLCLGWGIDGHQVVGKIATEFLTDRSRQEIAILLESDLDAKGRPSGRKTLSKVSTWADEIRSASAGRRTASWHYDNVPICYSDKAVTCPEGNCASAQLERHLKILADKTQPLLARNEALKWVVHLTADIHQPLHTADNADRGGNSLLVRGGNLHALWDVTLVQYARKKNLLDQPISDVTRWQQGTITTWMQESHGLAQTVAYGKLPTWVCNVVPEGLIDYGEGYLESAAPVAAEQLQRAGVRLAKLLNESLR